MTSATFRRLRPLAVALAAVVALGSLAAATGCSPDNGSDAVPVVKDVDETGRELATKFLSILESGDTAALDAFLDPTFQLQRADGTGATKAEYLADPAQVKSFDLGEDLRAQWNGSVLTVRYSIVVQAVVDGNEFGAGRAPRLSTFVWRDGSWRLASHANFNLPADETAPTLPDPDETGRELVIRFGEILQSKDRAALEAFLASGFQMQRADGTSTDRSEYLALDINLKNFALGDDLEAYQEGNALTVRWSAKVVETVDGQPRSEVFAPRLSTFLWVDGAWRLLSHANFNPPLK